MFSFIELGNFNRLPFKKFFSVKEYKEYIQVNQHCPIIVNGKVIGLCFNVFWEETCLIAGVYIFQNIAIWNIIKNITPSLEFIPPANPQKLELKLSEIYYSITTIIKESKK